MKHALLISILALSAEALSAQTTTSCGDTPSPYRATARHIEGKGIGYHTGYTSVDLFVTTPWSLPHKWIPFIDGRMHVFNNGKIATNIGLGARYVSSSIVYGINSYYDYRETSRQKYNQYSLGLEALGKVWDVRLNGYLPVGHKRSSFYNADFGYFSGNSILLKGRRDLAMRGLNLEAGIHIKDLSWLRFYGAFGPYYFAKAGNNAVGGKIRLALTFLDSLKIEGNTSYDPIFHWIGQGELSWTLPFGPNKKKSGKACARSPRLYDRALQPVDRQEIIVLSKKTYNPVARDPSTGNPYHVVFVDNTSSSAGTYENPYHSFAQVEENSLPSDIIYVFPGDGTTTHMDSGISLKPSQKFWGSGVNHPLSTTLGTISIPAQSSTSPIIKNENPETLGNTITLATNNAISGFTISTTTNDAIYGADCQNLEVSSCLFEDIRTYTIEATSTGDASISIANNQFVNNTNGVNLTLNGTSSLTFSNNTFAHQTATSENPIEISSTSNVLNILIENNLFDDNDVGSITVNLTDVIDAKISLLNNTMTNSRALAHGEAASLSILPNGTTDHCFIEAIGNTFYNNDSKTLYVHTSGAFGTFIMNVVENTIDTVGPGISFGSNATNFTLYAANNTFSNLSDNGISTNSDPSSTPFQNANITITNNKISDITNNSSAINLAQGSSNINVTIENNLLTNCQGSGITCYAPYSEFTNMTANITGNVISNCQNGGGNSASGISLETYVNLNATIANNNLSNNLSPDVALGAFTTGNPNVCLSLTGNSSNTDLGSTSYQFTNPGSGAFNLSPCNVDSVNTGTISPSGVSLVQSCPEGVACPP